MKMSAARHYRTWGRPRAPWNEFAGMGWRACFQAHKRTFRSFSIPSAFLVLPGAGRGTFTGRDCIKFMNS